MSLTPSGPPRRPSLPWRIGSSMIMGTAALVSKGFLYGCNSVEVVGMHEFVKLLDSRRDVDSRQRGLITVSNHISILDDPLVWGVLPLRFAFDPASLRWSLAAEDICFKNRALSRFFNLGQTLSTHRFKHSPFGGLFQPTMEEAIRLLSSEGYQPLTQVQVGEDGSAALKTTAAAPPRRHLLPPSPGPFFRPWGSHAWIHVFPEACVHQQSARGMRYFKWGVARLVLESGPSAPDVVPMFLDGTDRIMPEDRTFPRFLPRIGKKVRVVFGEALDAEVAFGDLRQRWRNLVDDAAAAKAEGKGARKNAVGPQLVDLEHGDEARAIRTELALRLRDEVLKLRRRLGYPDEEDGSLGLAETWAREPGVGYTYRSKVDGGLTSQR